LTSVTDKLQVTMTNVVFCGRDADGNDVFQKHEAVDRVPVEDLEAYVTDARIRWQHVEVQES
jgi:hypothetical protein